MEKVRTVQSECVGCAVGIAALIAILVGATGCQFRVGFDYNGQTGIKNVTATQLVDEDLEQYEGVKGR